MLSTLPRIRLLLFLGLAIAVASAIFLALEGGAASTPPPAQVSVLVAARDIAVAEPITPALVLVRQVPAAAPLGPAPVLAAALPQVLRSVAREPLYAGEVLSSRRLAGAGFSGGGTPALALLPKGYGLVGVRASRLNMPGSGLQPGDDVALLCTLARAPAPASDGGASLATSPLEVETILPSALVTHVDLPASGPEEGEVTLAVPRQEMQRVLLANRLGTFSFVPVRPDDRGQGPPGATTAPDLDGAAGPGGVSRGSAGGGMTHGARR